MTTQQPESLRLAEQYDYGDPAAHSNTWKVAVCTELRRQHVENETMRAGYAAARLEVESLKAQLVERAKEHADELTVAYMCGVSGPPIGQPQAMPDLSQLTERGAKAWAGVDAQGLRDGFTAADMATAAAQGFRDGMASVSPVSEPVAWQYRSVRDKGLWFDCTEERAQQRAAHPDKWDVRYLYTHPYPKEGMAGWISVDERLPEPGNPVLLDIGKKYPIRALWAAKNTVRVVTDVDDCGEYDEETDEYYCPEGWYEWNEHEEVHWAVSETPRAWRELPQPLPAATGPADGESNG